MIKTLAAALAGAVAASGGAAAQTELVFNAFGGHQHQLHVGIGAPWAQTVEQATAGRVKIKFPAASLAPPPDQFDMVEQGVADVAYMFNGFLQQRSPLLRVSLLPLVYTDEEGHGVGLWRTYKKHFEAKDQLKGVVVLGMFGGPGGHIFSMKEPITSVESLRRLKMWSTPASAKALNNLGVALVTGPAVRAFEIVSKGTVDGFASISIGEAMSFKVAQFAKSVLLIPGSLTAPTFTMFVNPKKWAAIAANDRQAILELSGERIGRLSRNWAANNRMLEEQFKAEGKPVAVAAGALLADLEKAWRPLHEEWIEEATKAGVDGRAAFAYFVEQSKAAMAGR
jgi:TRAP-type C4-dicarboxylate transport system substrate-binding protein